MVVPVLVDCIGPLAGDMGVYPDKLAIMHVFVFLGPSEMLQNQMSL